MTSAHGARWTGLDRAGRRGREADPGEPSWRRPCGTPGSPQPGRRRSRRIRFGQVRATPSSPAKFLPAVAFFLHNRLQGDSQGLGEQVQLLNPCCCWVSPVLKFRAEREREQEGMGWAGGRGAGVCVAVGWGGDKVSL